jgi:hypothetical protein
LAWEQDGLAIFEDFNRRGDPESASQLAHKWASATSMGEDKFRGVQEDFERKQKQGAGAPPPREKPAKEKGFKIVKALVQANTVGALEPVQFLWPDFIPKDSLGLIDGWPGAGKSTALGGIVAAMTRPGDWIGPTGSLPGAEDWRESGHAIWVSAEESEPRIKARLESCGADLSKVHIVRHITEANGEGKQRRRTFSLPGDMPLLSSWLATHKPVLVVLDNMSALFSAEYDSTKSQKSREILNELALLAEEHKTTILLVRHQTKGSANKDFNASGPAWLAGEGSIAFAGAARFVLRIGFMDEDNELPKWERRRVLHVSKANEFQDGMGVPFRIANIELAKKASVRIPKWEAAKRMDDEEVSSSGRSKPGPKAEKLPAAMEAIKGLFQARGGTIGHSELEELKHQLEQNEGFSPATLRRATEELKKSHFIRKDGKTWFYTPPLVTSEAELRALASDLFPSTSQGRGSGT